MRLLGWSEAPSWLQFNKFILTGYRPMQDAPTATASLFTIHNETTNIWTHLLPGLFALWLMASGALEDVVDVPVPSGMEDNYIFSIQGPFLRVFAFLNVNVFLCSAAYHGYMPCCRSVEGYRRLLACDVLAAFLAIVLSAFSFILFGDYCMPQEIRQGLLAVYVVSALLLTTAVVAIRLTIKGRVSVFGAFCTLRLLICFVCMLPKARRTGMWGAAASHMTSYFMLAAGGTFNVSRYPERLPYFYAGRKEKGPQEWRAIIDYFGNSHNVWHVLCAAATLLCLYGTALDQREFRIQAELGMQYCD